MDRRTLLRTGGIAIASSFGLNAISGVAVAGEADPRPADKEGTLPNDSLSTQQVDPLTGPEQFHEASTGTWIKHTNAWADGDCEVLDAIVENSKNIVHINGERIDDTASYWNDCVPSGDSYIKEWTFYTPPKDPGTYEFSWKIEFTGDGSPYPVGHEIGPFSHPYEVTKGGSGDDRGNGNDSRANSTAHNGFRAGRGAEDSRPQPK